MNYLMLLFDFPLLMVVAFLLLTIVLAGYSTKNVTTYQTYAIGNKNFSTATLVATLLATAFGGGMLMRNMEQTYHQGLSWITLSLLLSFFKHWFASRLAIRMRPFMHNLSIAETIGTVYGKYPRIVTALFSVCSSIAGIAIQIHVMSFAIKLCIGGDNARIITTFSTLILIVYSIIGGVRVVAFTDIIQLGAFFIILPVLSWWIFIKLDKSIPDIISVLQVHEKFQFSSMFRFDMKLVTWVALLLSSLVMFSPTIIQRIYMSSNCIQASRVFFNASIVSLIIKFLIILVGVLVFIAAPELSYVEVWPYIITNIPPILKGFVVISFLAVTMSTADSCLNTCTVMISHDILGSIRGAKPLSLSCQLWLTRLTCLFVSIGAIIALNFRDFFGLLYSMFDFSVPIITIPFILAVFRVRTASRTVLIGMVAGGLSVLAWNQWIVSVTGINGAFICMLVNGLTVLTAHYLFNTKPIKKIGLVELDDCCREIKRVATRNREYGNNIS